MIRTCDQEQPRVNSESTFVTHVLVIQYYRRVKLSSALRYLAHILYLVGTYTLLLVLKLKIG